MRDYRTAITYAATRAEVDADRIGIWGSSTATGRRASRAIPAMVPVVDADPLAPSALPTPDSYRWFTGTHETRAPSWRNEVTLRSVEMFTECEPGTYLPWISPTPLLMCVAEHDILTVADIALAGY